MKRNSGEVHDILIKTGESFTGFDPASLAPPIEPKIKKRIDDLPGFSPDNPARADIVALHPAPKLVGIPKKEYDKLSKEEKKAAVLTLENLNSEEKDEFPPSPKSEPKQEIEVETIPEPVKPKQDENGEVELSVGMEIIFDSGKGEEQGRIEALFEEEGQLLVSRRGEKKKEIIDAGLLKRIA